MKIGLIQLNIVADDKQTNHKRAAQFVRRAAQQGCDVAVLPELFDTGFSKHIATIVATGEHTPVFLSNLAHTHHINLIAGYAEHVAGSAKVNNVAAVHNPEGRLIARYSKIHPFSFAKEERYFWPGHTIVIFKVAKVPSAVFICYDLRFPEVFRSIAKDVHLLFVIANWPVSRKDHWLTLLKARAIENQCFVVGVNRTGISQQGLHFPGASAVFDPFGKTICTGAEADELVVTEIDMDEVARVRAKYPFLQDMKPFTMTLEE